MKSQEIDTIFNKLANNTALSEQETTVVFDSFFNKNSDITDSQIRQYLVSTAKNITAASLVGAAKSLRKHMVKVKTNLDVVDTCGTGGSGLNAFNTSTVAAFILAAAGQAVAKHGNRAATSKCGSADLLAELGINLELSTESLSSLLEKTNFCFMFAPQHHPATARVQLIRKELGIRTIFNFLGPLANPARAKRQVLGVSSKSMLKPMAEALLSLGSRHSLVVCGEDGLDEITLTSATNVYEIHQAEIRSYQLNPEDFGLPIRSPQEIEGSLAEVAAKRTKGILSGEKGALRDIVVLNAAAALYISEITDSIANGVKKAQELVDSGLASETLERIVNVSKELSAN